MTAEQQELCRELIVSPPRGASRISREEFLRQAAELVEHGTLATKVLEEAYAEQSPEDLQCALIVGHTFGFGPQHMETLCRLVDVDWHHSHEDVIAALDSLRSTLAVEALFRATQWVPTSLNYDDSRALAVKAIWALGKIPGSEAEERLRTISHADNPILEKAALEQLKRRGE